MKIFIILVIGFAVIAGGFYLFSTQSFSPKVAPENQESAPLQNSTKVDLRVVRIDVDQGSRDVVDGAVQTKPAVIRAYDSSNNLIKTISSEDGVETLFAKTSPDGRFIYYGWGRGDAHQGTFYSIIDDSTRSVGQVTSMKKWGWLRDGKFEYWAGCATAGDCRRMRSADAQTPWVFAEVSSDGAAFVE